MCCGYRQHQTPRRGDRLIGLAAAAKKESTLLHGLRVTLCYLFFKIRLKSDWDQSISKDLPCKGRFSNQRECDVGALTHKIVRPLSNLLVLQPLYEGE